jgi:hypothetical protein
MTESPENSEGITEPTVGIENESLAESELTQSDDSAS